LYNIGSGRAETWNSLVDAAFKALNVPKRVEYIEMPESLRDRYQYYTCAEMDKLHAAGYTAEATSLEDAVKMLWHLACVNCEAHGLYNIGSGRAETWNSLVDAAFKALNVPKRVEYIEMPESLRDRYQYYTCAEMDKLHAAGYTAEATSLKDAVRDYLVNYCAQGKYLGDE
jgi:nucleoside-diphosphate-sugar epimerase